MTVAKIAAAIAFAFASFLGYCHAQEPMPLRPISNASAVIAMQLSSPTNYALLQPMANKAVNAKTPISGMLQPIDDAATDSKTDGPIVVLPHSFKRSVFDRHEFMVRNDGDKKLKKAKILLAAPKGSIVQQVVPKPDSVTGPNVELTIGELSPGEHQIVEVAIKYPRNELAHFETKVTSWSLGNSSSSSEGPAAQSRMMLKPKSSGMLKPKPPVMNASATTRRVIGNGQGGSNIAQSTATVMGERKQEPSKLLQPLVPEFVKQAEAQSLPSEPIEATIPRTTIETSLIGPRQVQVGSEVEFVVEVKNVSPEVAKSVVVQLSIPEQMNVTNLDRAAWYDSENRKVSWELSELAGGMTETIRYRAVIKTGCSVEQNVVTGYGNEFQGESAVRTTAN